MKIFKRSIATLFLISVFFFGFISCEENFQNIESEVLKNTFSTSNEVNFDIKIIRPTENISSVRADNITIGNNFNGYWLGNYIQNSFSKSIKSGFVSQLSLPNTTLSTVSSVNPTDIRFFLDKVVLKIPYNSFATSATGSNGETLFELDSILSSNTNLTPTNIEVYRNPFFLNTLKPTNVKEQNIFPSNFNYFSEIDEENEKELLSEDNFSYTPSNGDTKYFFNRLDRSTDLNSTQQFRDSIVLRPRDIDGVLQPATQPFLAIPLNLEKMKALFWDMFDTNNFASDTNFQDYFRGIVVLPKDKDGVLVPFNINSGNAEVSFIFSIVDATDPNDIVITYREYNFTLNGVQNAIYEMSEATQETTTDSFVIQGTAGSNAKIEILGVNLADLPQDHPFQKHLDKDINNNGYLELEELKGLKDENGKPTVLINDAELEFYVNNSINDDASKIPNRLYLYRNTNSEEVDQPTNLVDAIESPLSFGGLLSLTENENPSAYKFKITNFVSDFFNEDDKKETTLTLKVFNEFTDDARVTNGNSVIIRTDVENYNWNPRSVVLFNETVQDSEKAKIKVLFTELND